MKNGKSIEGLMTELERQVATKRDFKAPAGRIVMATDGEAVNITGAGEFGINPTAHANFGEYLEIPKKYYDRMLQADKGLLAENVNSWFAKKGAEFRLVRTLDGNVRALLSDRYRPLDNYDLVKAIIPIIRDDSNFTVKSCEVTERRLYIQIVHKKLMVKLTGVGHQAVKIEDDLSAGLVISNSEIGDGSLRVEPAIYTGACTNMMISMQAIRKYHVGRSGGGDLDSAVEFYRTETRKADDQAFWMKVQDAVTGAFDEAKFRALVKKLEGSTADVLPANAELPAVVEVIANRYGFSEVERKAVEGHFLRKADFSRYGMISAVTRAAQDAETYDRAVELERFGGDLLDLPTREWEKVGATVVEDGELVLAKR